jgi:hypothetical protein
MLTIKHLFLFTTLIAALSSLPLPLNEYSYILARDQLRLIDTNTPRLSPRENTVSLHYDGLKRAELSRTLGHFYASRPIEDNLADIQSSELYAKLKPVPKGGNIHLHEDQMTNRRQLLELIFNSPPEFERLHICDRPNSPFCAHNACRCQNYTLKYFGKESDVDDGWLKVKGSSRWTIEAILSRTTLIGILNGLENKVYATDSAKRWALAIDLGVFVMYSDLINFNKTRFDFLRLFLDASLDESVQLVEMRRFGFGELYYFDASGDRVGISANNELAMLRSFKAEYIERNPSFIDFVFIVQGHRGSAKKEIKAYIERAIEMQRDHADLIRGFDLVGEEDGGHTLLYHSQSLIEGFNYMQTEESEGFGFEFHAVETNWPRDMVPAQFGDDGPTADNVYDSIVFGTRRIGHGLGVIKHPGVYGMIKRRGIAIEACPSSNQILGECFY